MKDLKALYDEVSRVIDSLPQRSVISDEVADRWINGVIRMDPTRAVWHAKRAGGLGGSEIGELLLEEFGEPTYLQDAESIVRSKLLLELPHLPNYAMRRGTALEGFVEQLYLQRTGTQPILDRPDIAAAFEGAHPEHPFIRGNPDQVVVNPKGQIVIPDFKVRGDLDWASKLNLVNIAQCHWYGMLLERGSGNAPAYYSLAELDLPAAVADQMMRVYGNPQASAEEKHELTAHMIETINKLNMPGFGLRVTAFDRNPDLEKALIEVGSKFWNEHVLTGKPYQKIGHPLKEHVPVELAEQVQVLLNQQLRNRLHERVASEEAKATQGKIGTLLGEYDFRSWPISTPGISYSQTSRVNYKAAVDSLLADGVPRESLYKAKSAKLSIEKAMATLEEHGLLNDSLFEYDIDQTAVKKALEKHQSLNIQDFEFPAYRAQLSTKKDDQEILKNLTHDVRRHIHSFDVAEQYPEVYQRGDEPGESENSGPQLA